MHMQPQYFLPTPLDYAEERADKPFKHTFFDSMRLLAGLNCLSPGQSQPVHEHPHQDKFYLVLEGSGAFTVGDETVTCEPGALIIAPAGIPHGVHNAGQKRLVFLTTIAPGMAG
jgi:mannose-6-phosphate isomerase-like protein (cupin superfamily)